MSAPRVMRITGDGMAPAYVEIRESDFADEENLAAMMAGALVACGGDRVEFFSLAPLVHAPQSATRAALAKLVKAKASKARGPEAVALRALAADLAGGAPGSHRPALARLFTLAAEKSAGAEAATLEGVARALT